MTHQLDLFGNTAPYQPHSVTSRRAAAAIEPDLGKLQMEVYAWLVQHGPATDEVMQEALDMNPSTHRPRRVELCDKGLVIDTGMQRLTRSGRSATVWGVVK